MKRDLSLKQALAEAQERFGKNAQVRKEPKCSLITTDSEYGKKHPQNVGRCTGFLRGHAQDCLGGRTSVTVGSIEFGGLFFSIKVGGMAYTFREAFKQIDDYKVLEHARYVASACKRRKHHKPDSICGMCSYQGPEGKEYDSVMDPENLEILRARMEAK